MTSRPAVLEISGLSVAYGSRTILDGVELRVEAGDVVTIIGGSGSGKSTLLKCVVGLLSPRSGVVRLLGEESTHLTPEERGHLLRRVGVLFQHGALLNSMTVGENVALPLEMHTALSADQIAALVYTRLGLVGLRHAQHLLPEELSGGMRKRAALARALALEPTILFCDEPGAGLDPVTAADIDKLLLTLNGNLGMTLVIITHELLSIQRLNGRVVMLESGRLVFTGSVAQARTSDHPSVRRFFDPGS